MITTKRRVLAVREEPRVPHREDDADAAGPSDVDELGDEIVWLAAYLRGAEARYQDLIEEYERRRRSPASRGESGGGSETSEEEC